MDAISYAFDSYKPDGDNIMEELKKINSIQNEQRNEFSGYF